uniref:Potassium channel domain-containing protein n=2 Tax=Ciona savignyi TaxID=51511 RepID=H2YJM1_CIOSA
MRHTANSRTITLIVVGLTYLFIGAGIFSAIERQNEIESSKELFGYENHFRTLYNISDADFENLTYVIMGLQPHKAGVQWSFVGSLYFAITVVTTIGYGHAVPQTTTGKLACIAYAVLGIPLCLVMFQAMGDRMNNSAKSMLKSAGRKLGFKFDEISHKCLIPFGILSCCVTVAVGSVAFSHFEGWSYLNSVYYCVMTLSTIGFGDYVALQADGALQQRPQYVAFSFIYILIGLTVIGAFLNLVILRLIVTNSESGFQHHEFRRKVRKR